MSGIQALALGYLAGINLVSFAMMGMDKLFAKRSMRRISERALLTAAALGGAPLALLGMAVFRHKIRKGKFIFLIPIMLILQCAAAFLCFRMVPQI